jgi:hypothetical protein
MTPAHERADVERAWCDVLPLCDEVHGVDEPDPRITIRLSKLAEFTALRTSPEQSGKPDREAVAREDFGDALDPNAPWNFRCRDQQGRLFRLMQECGYDPRQTHPDCYQNFSWTTFVERLWLALPAPPPSTSPEARAPEELRALSEKATPGKLEVGQHPAVPNGWIVKPVLFGNRVRILPECEGGHVVLRSEDDAKMLAESWNFVRSLLQRGDHGER